MKKIVIVLFIFCIPIQFVAAEEPERPRKKSEWYLHFDERLTLLETQLLEDMEIMRHNQEALTQEMHRLNDRLENRFDKYFLWGYGTLMVVISTVVSVIFNKQKDKRMKSKE